MHCLVDARMLDTLSKKELEKMLGVTRKFHQASIVHGGCTKESAITEAGVSNGCLFCCPGIHVLRLVRYDRQELAMRRHQSENVDSDPIVWTNQRFVKWVRSIDLGEYADNLKGEYCCGGGGDWWLVTEDRLCGGLFASGVCKFMIHWHHR